MNSLLKAVPTVQISVDKPRVPVAFESVLVLFGPLLLGTAELRNAHPSVLTATGTGIIQIHGLNFKWCDPS